MKNVYKAFPLLFLFMFSSYTTKHDATGRNQNDNAVPFKATITTSIQISGMPPRQNVLSSGTGVATHLGQITFRGNAFVNFTVNPVEISDGIATITAANGDELYTSYSGTTTTVLGITTGHFVHVITGGTGRFADASGTLTGSTYLNMATGENRLVLEGSIDY